MGNFETEITTHTHTHTLTNSKLCVEGHGIIYLKLDALINMDDKCMIMTTRLTLFVHCCYAKQMLCSGVCKESNHTSLIILEFPTQLLFRVSYQAWGREADELLISIILKLIL